jgi:hypothetical protein
MALDLPTLVAGELRILLRPLTEIAGADDPVLALDRFVRSCGWRSEDVIDPAPVLSLMAGLEEAAAVLEAGLVPSSITEAIERVELFGGLVEDVRALGEGVAPPGALSGAALAAFGEDVIARLLLGWLEARRPLLDLVRVTGLLELAEAEAFEDGSMNRAAGHRPQLRPDLLGPLLSDPLGRLAATLAPDGWDQPEGATLSNLVLRSTLGSLARAIGGRWRTHPDLLRRPDQIATIGRQAVLELPLSAGPGGPAAAFRAELEFLSRADGGPAVRMQPRMGFGTHAEIGEWSLDTAGSLLVGGAAPGTPASITIGPGGVDGPPGLTAELGLTGARTLDLVLGSGRTGLTLGDVELGLFAKADGETPDAGFSLMARRSSVGLSTADFGRIVSAILDFEAAVEFDLGLEWSLDGGLRLSGSASLEIPLSDGFDLGIIAFSDLRLAFTPDDPLVIGIAGDVTIVIGPLSLTFEGLGLRIEIRLTGMDLLIEPDPPHRVEFTVTSEAVNGGGFLDIDAETGRYVGGLALDIFGLGLSAIVIVDTELPSGDGWALFGSIGLVFPQPIPLSFGFTLIGVGGLLALHRTMDVDALAADLRTGAMDSILFPEDIETDADAVLAGLDVWFPLKDGSTVFGPVVQIGWGSPTLITAQLGIVIALPDLIIAVLGSVEILLPTPDEAVLSLRMDVIGAIDVPASEFIVAASLHDSNLLGTFELSGDMGFYLRLSGQPVFLLSVGGYHPQFDPPGALPSWLLDLRRTTAAVPLGENVEIVLTSYVAVTSNTLQFGGRFRLEASVEVLLTTYTAEGWFGINVLLVFKPFKIVAGASAGVSISAGDKELFGVSLLAHLEGPEPWYATGRATFTFFGLDVDFGFDIGTRPGGEPRDSHDVAEDVVLALQAAEAWQAVESSDAWAAGVITGEELPAGLWVRPDQEVEVRQPVAPLNRTITAFGELVPEDDRIDATNVKVGGAVVPAPEWLDDWFAPAQFDRLDDTSRLSSPSYELMTAGVRFGAAGIGISADPDRECTTVSREPETSVFPDTDGKLSRFVSPTRPAAAPAVRRTVRGVPLAVSTTGYTVVRTADGIAALDAAVLNYAEAVAAVAAVAANGHRAVKIAPAHAAVAT